MKRTSLALAITALTAGLGAPALAQSTSTPPAMAPAPAATELQGPAVAVTTRAITGNVIEIDRATRMVTVRGDTGNLAVVKVGANVPNFDTIDLGDTVTMRYTEAVALAVAKGGIGTEAQLGEIRTKVQSDAARKVHDEMPGMAVAETTTLVANVFQIDRKTGVLTLRGTDGVPVNIKVPDKNVLDTIKLDDQIVIGYLQAAAVSINPGKG